MTIQLSGPSFKTLKVLETPSEIPYAMSKVYITSVPKAKGQLVVRINPDGRLQMLTDGLGLAPIKLIWSCVAEFDTTVKLRHPIQRFRFIHATAIKKNDDETVQTATLIPQALKSDATKIKWHVIDN